MTAGTQQQTQAPRTVHEFTSVTMDTLVNIKVVSRRQREQLAPSIERALAWFETVERICSRFEPTSEVMKLSRQAGKPVRTSAMLFELVALALELARLTDGAFDPTIGAELEQRGFTINYRTGQDVRSGLAAGGVSHRDVRLDRAGRRITLKRPLVLDLNSVAKGLALDLAAEEMRDLGDFCIEAGGDVVARGHNLQGDAWQVGIAHPRAPGLLAETISVRDAAVCTSGDYERPGHVLDARTGQPVVGVASVTVVAPTALAADGLSTAAMIVGSERAVALLKEQDVRGVLVMDDGTVVSV